MCIHQAGGGLRADMMSTSSAHGKLNPRIGNPLGTHNSPGCGNQKPECCVRWWRRRERETRNGRLLLRVAKTENRKIVVVKAAGPANIERNTVTG